MQVVVISLAQGPVEQVPDLYHNYLYSDQVRNESVSKNNQILLTFMAFSFDDTHKAVTTTTATERNVMYP